MISPHFRLLSQPFGYFLSKSLAMLLIACSLVISPSLFADSEVRNAIPSELAIHSLLTDAVQVDGLMVVVGERGHILSSRDQGHSWQQGKVPSRELLTGVFMLDQQLGWAVGHQSTILRTRDGGLSWQRLKSGVEDEAPLLDIWFQDAQHGIAIGAYGLLLVSDDGGDSWQQQWLNDEDDFHLNRLLPLAGGSWLISAEAGLLYRSEDQGDSWQSLDSPYHGSFYGAMELGEQGLWVFGLRGHLFHSLDNGDSWQVVETNSNALLTSALKTRAGNCYVAGHGGVLLINRGCDGESVTLQQLAGRKAITALLESEQGILLIGEMGIERLEP